MMYNNKLSACIKVNGKVLREDGDKVYIPFGSEYTISIKNHNSVRAAVSVEIDSTDATDGHDLIIHPNSTVEFTRFIKNGNLKSGNAFKFIERIASIEEHRGVGQSDGLVRISYQFEKVLPKTQVVHHEIHHHYNHRFNDYSVLGRLGRSGPDITYGSSGIAHAINNSSTNGLEGLANNAFRSAAGLMSQGETQITSTFTTSANASPQAMNYTAEVGITVPGEVKHQEFNVITGFIKELEQHAIVIQLFGQSEQGAIVVAPVTVKTKLTCTSCGKVNKSSNKFCSNCGTGLHIV